MRQSVLDLFLFDCGHSAYCAPVCNRDTAVGMSSARRRGTGASTLSHCVYESQPHYSSFLIGLSLSLCFFHHPLFSPSSLPLYCFFFSLFSICLSVVLLYLGATLAFPFGFADVPSPRARNGDVYALPTQWGVRNTTQPP